MNDDQNIESTNVERRSSDVEAESAQTSPQPQTDSSSSLGVDSQDAGNDARRTTPDELQTKCDEYLNGWKRALADYENLQKSISQNRQADHRRLVIDLAESLLPVVDNFGYVLKHVPDVRRTTPEFEKMFNTWFQGIEHINRQFSEALKSLGVEPIEALGQKFDPHLHESGGSRHEEGKEAGIVLEESIKGWKVGDMVIRPAKVIVNDNN
jgi:molecular chaperone GrpE